MRLSEKVDKLLPALAAIQNRVDVKKNKANPHHKNKYADIEAIIDACVPELEAQGLLFLQTLDDENIQPGQVLVLTRIVHVDSNQWVESRFKMDAKAATPQDLGSAITYARRYSLVTALGLAPEDDDGNKAQGSTPIQRKTVAAQRASQLPISAHSSYVEGVVHSPNPIELKKQIRAEMLKKGLNAQQITELTGVSGVFTLEDSEMLASVLQHLKAG